MLLQPAQKPLFFIRRCYFLCVLVIIPLFSGQSNAGTNDAIEDPNECHRLLAGRPKTQFRNPGEEISYTNRYNACWGESLILNSQPAQRSFIGSGLSVFANPAYVEAIPFSQQFCGFLRSKIETRADYPCWFEARTAQKDVSIELAAKQEIPKMLFVNSIPNRDGTMSVEYILCTNDDPTKAKERTPGCKRRKKMTISEYGRGDVNGDHDEDILVNIKYSDYDDTVQKCFIGAFSRREGELLRMISYSPPGLCQ